MTGSCCRPYRLSLPFGTKIKVSEDQSGSMGFMNPTNKLVTIALETNSLVTPDRKRDASGWRGGKEESLSEDPEAPWLEASVQDGFYRFQFIL